MIVVYYIVRSSTNWITCMFAGGQVPLATTELQINDCSTAGRARTGTKSGEMTVFFYSHVSAVFMPPEFYRLR